MPLVYKFQGKKKFGCLNSWEQVIKLKEYRR